jgi:hypothetical protein
VVALTLKTRLAITKVSSTPFLILAVLPVCLTFSSQGFKMAKLFKFKNSQKLRVIINGVSMYSTAKQVRWGVGDFITVNAAIAAALRALENTKGDQDAACGLCGSWNGFQVQIDQL